MAKTQIGRKSKLTPQLIDQLCRHLKTGTFDYAAAQAVGISKRTFYRWLEQGRQEEDALATREESGEEIPDSDLSLFWHFWHKVSQSTAIARIDAEKRVFTEDPFKWLRYGPGRERPGQPGWTDESTVNVKNDQPTEYVLVWNDQVIGDDDQD